MTALGTVRRVPLTAAIVLAGFGGDATALSPPEPPASPEEIVAYHDSGRWSRDIDAVIARARAHLARRLEVRRPALVLDVDDTSLSNYECLKQRDFERSPDSPCARGGDLPAIPQTLRLYRYARRHGVTVLFVTGRRERLRRATVTNLRAAGYAGRLRLRMRPNRERPGTHDGFKARQRRSFARRGFTIVANVGDQRSDLDGGWAQRTFKLPNPMYLIAEA